MIDSQRGAVGYNHLIYIQQARVEYLFYSKQSRRTARSCGFDFALQKQPEDKLMAGVSRAWYIGSYTMVAKPFKSLGLH